MFKIFKILSGIAIVDFIAFRQLIDIDIWLAYGAVLAITGLTLKFGITKLDVSEVALAAFEKQRFYKWPFHHVWTEGWNFNWFILRPVARHSTAEKHKEYEFTEAKGKDFDIRGGAREATGEITYSLKDPVKNKHDLSAEQLYEYDQIRNTIDGVLEEFHRATLDNLLFEETPEGLQEIIIWNKENCDATEPGSNPLMEGQEKGTKESWLKEKAKKDLQDFLRNHKKPGYTVIDINNISLTLNPVPSIRQKLAERRQKTIEAEIKDIETTNINKITDALIKKGLSPDIAERHARAQWTYKGYDTRHVIDAEGAVAIAEAIIGLLAKDKGNAGANK